MIAVTSTKARTKAKSIRSTTTTTPTIATTLAATMSHIALQVLTVNVLLLLLALRPPTARALPITSKPIEGTAEHLAWQAWLMLPPEQKELEKSRKVTPKSIFTLPFRDCPPGHQLFQSRCIPTVNINQSELLTQQVLGFIVGNGGGGGGTNSADAQYEFDYDDEELGMSIGEEQQVLVYDAPQRFHGAAADETPSNYDARDVAAAAPSAQSPPNKDEPLKFNLFQQQHFSTNDYEADSAGVEGSGSAAKPPLPLERGVPPPQSVDNATQFLSAVQSLLHRPSNASTNGTTYNNYNNNNNTSSSQNHTVDDLQSESSNISTNFVAHTTTTTTTTKNGVVSAPVAHSFAFSEIDAIALPAAGAGADFDAATASLGGDLETQRVSLFKDDSAVQLVTTVIADADVTPTVTATTTTAKVQQPLSVAQMLRAEALLPLKHEASAAQIATPTTASSTTTTTTTFAALDADDTALAPQSLDDDRISLDYLLDVAADSTTTTTTTTTTKMHNSLHELAAAAGQHAGERPRSVAPDIGDDDMEAQELHFSTTEEPEGTTNFQIDETTVIETQQPTDLLAIVQQQQTPDGEPDQLRERQHVVLKKSKVEPVGDVSTTATAATMPPATATTTTQRAAATAVASLATPLPSAMAAAEAAVADDRFGGEVVDANAALSVGAGRRRGSSFASANNNNNNNADKASFMAASEMNIEQELRMINELVKGKRQLVKIPTAMATTTTTTTATATATTPTTTASGETTTTTAAETAASATARNTVATTTTNSAASAKVAPLTAETTTKIAQEAKTSETTTTTAAAATTVTAASALSRVVANEKETTTTTTATTSKNAPTKAKALLESGQRVGVAAKTTTTTTATTTTATAPTTTTTTATEPSSTIWSKIMPIFGWATTTATKVEEVPTTTTTLKEASTDSDTTTKTSLDAVETETTVRKAAAESSSARAPILNASSASPHKATSASLSSQRSHRNSKIINVNHLDANSVSDSDATTTTTTAIRTRTQTTKDDTADAIDIDAPDEVTEDPFWWLPMGWRLDRPNTNDDQNLLMRFWSSFPESSTKARS